MAEWCDVGDVGIGVIGVGKMGWEALSPGGGGGTDILWEEVVLWGEDANGFEEEYLHVVFRGRKRE